MKGENVENNSPQSTFTIKPLAMSLFYFLTLTVRIFKLKKTKSFHCALFFRQFSTCERRQVNVCIIIIIEHSDGIFSFRFNISGLLTFISTLTGFNCICILHLLGIILYRLIGSAYHFFRNAPIRKLHIIISRVIDVLNLDRLC